MKTLKWMIVGVLFAAGGWADFAWNDEFDTPEPSIAWDEDCSGSLNANWTTYTAGSGAFVTHSNSMMVMDTAVVNGSAQAALNTATDQSGTLTEYNGEKLYNFYAFPVTARFDIASMSGDPGGRNVFYFSIGDDSVGNYMPQNGVMDDGLGFALERLDVGSGPYWRIVYQALDNASASGGVVANISGLPTALTYELNGTNALIVLEGATVTAFGIGSGSVGGNCLTVALDDLTANISGYTMAFGAYNFGTADERTVVMLDSVTVRAGGGTFDSSYTEYTAGAGAGVCETNGQLVLDVGVANGSAQAALSTHVDQSGTLTQFDGDVLYNFYEHPLQIDFDIASISGTNGSGRNVFYFSIGDDSAGNYMPQNTVLDDGIGFALEQVTTTPYWRIVYQSLNNASASGGVVANISGVPSALSFLLDGTNAIIRLDGATITAVGGYGSGTVGGVELGVTLADLSASVSGYTLAFGAYNQGNVTDRTVVTLNSFSAEPYYGAVNYGATPDDAVDDTTAIQAALDAADSHAGFDTVYVAQGEYTVGMLRIGSDTALLGAGSDGDVVSRLVMQDGHAAGNNILRNKDTVNGNTNIILSGICFDGNKSFQTNTYLHLANMWNVTGLLVDQCRFQNSQAIGLVVQSTLGVDSGTWVNECYATGNVLGFYAQARSPVVNGLRGVDYTDCIAVSNDWGFDVYLADDVEYSNCRAVSNVTGTARGFTADSCVDLRYTNCVADANASHGFAVYINLDNLQQPSNVFFSACSALNNGDDGFRIENAADVTLYNVCSFNNLFGVEALSSFRTDRACAGLIVDSSDILENKQHGIWLRGISNSVISACSIRNNSVQSTAGYDGIKIQHGTYLVPNLQSRDILIEDNQVCNDSGGKQRYGVLSDGDTDYISLLYNDLTPNQTGPYLLAGQKNTVVGNN